MAGKKVFDEVKVLDKAMNLFWRKGYNSTSAQDLVDELGISRSSLYNAYGDKHSLFIKSLLKYRKEWIEPAIEGANSTTDAEQYIKSLFDFIKKETFDLNQTKGCFWVNTAIELSPSDSEVTVIAKKIMTDMENAFYKAIKTGQKQGIFTTSQTARSLAKFVFNAISGLRVNVKLDANEKTFDIVTNICLSVLKA